MVRNFLVNEALDKCPSSVSVEGLDSNLGAHVQFGAKI